MFIASELVHVRLAALLDCPCGKRRSLTPSGLVCCGRLVTMCRADRRLVEVFLGLRLPRKRPTRKEPTATSTSVRQRRDASLW